MTEYTSVFQLAVGDRFFEDPFSNDIYTVVEIIPSGVLAKDENGRHVEFKEIKPAYGPDIVKCS